MISATISNRVKELLINGLVKESPIEVLGDKTFLRFDSITFDKNTRRVTFSFEGNECFHVIHSLTNAPDTVTLQGVKGNIQVQFVDGIMK